MQELAAYSTLAVTLGLVMGQPRVWANRRLSPALAACLGVGLLGLLGIVGLSTVERAVTDLWRPFVAIGSIMVMTEVAHRVGLLELWSTRIEAGATTAARLFGRVFLLSVVTAATLNNDAAILLVTPLVVTLVRRRFPDRPDLFFVFAFAVFMGAGVAPLVVSNPMNMVVAELAGIDFNTYALHMVPVAAASWIVTFVVLRLLFARALRAEPAPGDESRPAITRQQWAMMALLGGVLVAYPVASLFGLPVWGVAVAGAGAALWVAHVGLRDDSLEVVKTGVSWETLIFLFAVLILSLGLLEVGFVEHLSAHYGKSSLAGVGVTSAVGSALLNNHPMSHLNVLALNDTGALGNAGYFAALIGGDLGPRLLPMGSLAGLLWLALLRRHGVEIRLLRFIKVGVIVTIPTLAASLFVLALLA